MLIVTPDHKILADYTKRDVVKVRHDGEPSWFLLISRGEQPDVTKVPAISLKDMTVVTLSYKLPVLEALVNPDIVSSEVKCGELGNIKVDDVERK
jgi:hypothetical protein